MSVGDLTEEDVEGIRTGRIPDPAVSKVAALAAAFGVPPSYLVARGTDLAILDEETLTALSDETAGAIFEGERPPTRKREGGRARDSAVVRGLARGRRP
jgi:hypothetical protein